MGFWPLFHESEAVFVFANPLFEYNVKNMHNGKYIGNLLIIYSEANVLYFFEM